jgi:hypothetical protein
LQTEQANREKSGPENQAVLICSKTFTKCMSIRRAVNDELLREESNCGSVRRIVSKVLPMVLLKPRKQFRLGYMDGYSYIRLTELPD